MIKFKLFLLALTTAWCQYNDDRPVKPEKCYGSNDIFNRRCCILPAFFDRQIARSCGGLIHVSHLDKKANVAIVQRHSSGECSYWECILNKYRILNPDKTVSEEKFFTHLDKWVTLNTDFSTIMLSAKIYCRQQYRMFMPLSCCEFYGFLLCIRNYINVDCPTIIQSKECFEWKDFFDECRDFFT